MILKFGKYCGEHICDVPREYLEWLLQVNKEAVAAIEEELHIRDLAEEANIGWVDRLVLTGYRELAKRCHPDVGGTKEDMQALNAAVAAVRQAIGGK